MPKIKLGMSSWLETIAGQQLLESEARFLTKILNSKWGDHLVQIGGSTAKIWRVVSPIIHQVCFEKEAVAVEEATLVVGDFRELAFLPSSLDVILLPHVVEEVQDLEALLDELYQALKAEGLLVLAAFNPHGFGFLWRLQFFWCGLMPKLKWRSTYELMESLHLAGFNQIQRYSIAFQISPFRKTVEASSWKKALRWLCPTAGAVTLLCAKKEEFAPLQTVVWNTKASVGVLQNQAHE